MTTTTATWTVSLDFADEHAADEHAAGVAPDAIGDAIGDALELLADRGGVIAHRDGEPRIGVTLTAHGVTAAEALDDALGAWRAVAARTGMPGGPAGEPTDGPAGGWAVVRAEVVTADELAAALRDSPFPEVVGTAEAAAMLGVSRTRVAELARTLAEFPTAVAQLAATPVWPAASIRAFADRWERKSGRPAGSPGRGHAGGPDRGHASPLTPARDAPPPTRAT